MGHSDKERLGDLPNTLKCTRNVNSQQRINQNQVSSTLRLVNPAIEEDKQAQMVFGKLQARDLAPNPDSDCGVTNNR